MGTKDDIRELKKTVEELSSQRRFNKGNKVYFFAEGLPHSGYICSFSYNREHSCWAYEVYDERNIWWKLDTEDGLLSKKNLKKLCKLIKEG